MNGDTLWLWLKPLLNVLLAVIISATGCLAAIMLAVWAEWLP